MENRPMRDIKFRAWDETNKKMINSGFFVGSITGIIGEIVAVQNDKDPILSYKHDWILEQYTGLKDKNGVEIYGGDIVEAVGQEVVKITKNYRKMKAGIYNFVVFWNESFVGWGFKHSIGSIHPNVDIREYKVIGNIHDSPNLLESPK